MSEPCQVAHCHTEDKLFFEWLWTLQNFPDDADCDDDGKQVSVTQSIELMSLTADEGFVQLLTQ